MIDRLTFENAFKGLGLPEANIGSAMPLLLGQGAETNHPTLLEMSQAGAHPGGASRRTGMRTVEAGELHRVRIGRRASHPPRQHQHNRIR